MSDKAEKGLYRLFYPETGAPAMLKDFETVDAAGNYLAETLNMTEIKAVGNDSAAYIDTNTSVIIVVRKIKPEGENQ